jgi:outer membrane receptor for ferrienterochelin and colicins
MSLKIASVSGASGYQQKVTRAPSLVSIVTADDVKKFGYRTLADILQSVRGFFITYDRNYAYLGVRGFGRPGDYDSRILLLIDGHRVNENIYGGGPVGTDFPLDVDLIDRVEIVRGPSSSLYGTGAFFGVVSVITRGGRDLKGAEISGEAGSQKTYKGRLTYGNEFKNGWRMVLSGTYYQSAGQDRSYYPEYDNPSTNNGIAQDRDGDRFKSGFGKLSFKDFTLEGVYHSRAKDIRNSLVPILAVGH